MLALALGIALLPPIWAVIAPFVGIQTGAVALICAGLYAARGNQVSEAPKMILGFLLGDGWALLAIFFMEKVFHFSPNAELYLTLFILGGLAVIVGECMSKWIFTPSWLCGWAIGLTIMGPMQLAELGSLPLQIGVAMIVGVVYVGMGVELFRAKVAELLAGKKHS